jgi:hypothetical protein
LVCVTSRSYFVFISFRAVDRIPETSDRQYLEESIGKGGVFKFRYDLSQYDRAEFTEDELGFGGIL